MRRRLSGISRTTLALWAVVAAIAIALIATRAI
jgi:hypothetical protein